MSIADFFEVINKNTNIDPMDLIAWLVMIIAVMWLYKRIESSYQNNIKIQRVKRDKYKEKISRALYFSYRYNSDKSITEDFFSSVYSCFPLLNSNKINEIENLLENPNHSEKDKIDNISRKLKKELINTSKRDDELSQFKLGAELAEKLFRSLINVLIPPVLTFITFFLILNFITFFYKNENILLDFISMLVFIYFIFVLLLLGDLYRDKDLTKGNKTIKFIALIVSLIISIPIFVQYYPKVYLSIFGVFFVISIILSLKYDNHNEKNKVI